MRKPQVGDVYRTGSTGPKFKGRLDGTYYWLVVAVHDDPKRQSVHLLGMDKNFKVVSSSGRGIHAMAERRREFTIKGFVDIIKGIEYAAALQSDEAPF